MAENTEKKKVLVSVPATLWLKVKMEALKKGISVSDIVAEALKRYVK
ncbi:MAG: hypothetical protein QW175_02835 [Candidatus Bathyarchaeia archaeon]